MKKFIVILCSTLIIAIGVAAFFLILPAVFEQKQEQKAIVHEEINEQIKHDNNNGYTLSNDVIKTEHNDKKNDKVYFSNHYEKEQFENLIQIIAGQTEEEDNE